MPPTSTDGAAPSRPGPRQRQEQQVAPGHEGVGQAVGLHLDGAVGGQRGVADLAQQRQVQQVVVAQRAPVRETRAQLARTTSRQSSSMRWRWP
jgi:hypothetical protein